MSCGTRAHDSSISQDLVAFLTLCFSIHGSPSADSLPWQSLPVDIGYTLLVPDKPPIIKGIDLVITHANPKRAAAAATEPGTAAAVAHEDKAKSYTADFSVPVGRFYPFAMETGGRLSNKSRLFLATFVRADVMQLDSDDKMSSGERVKYNSYLRELIEAVGVTLAKATAGALLWNSGGRCPCPRTVLAGGALQREGVGVGSSAVSVGVEPPDVVVLS